MAAFDLKSIQHQLPELLTPSSPNDLKEDEIFEAHIKEDSSAPPILPEPAPLPPRSNLNQKTKEDIFAALEEEERLLELKEKEEERAALLREKAKLDEKAKQEKAKEEEEKGKGKGKGKEKVRKSVTWSETSQVKEFVSHEILESPTTPRLSIEPAPPTDGSSSIIPSVPFSTLNRQLKGTYQEPLKPEPTPEPPKEKKEIMRTMVVERPMAPPRLPGAGGGAYKRSVFRDSNKGKGREVTEGLSSNSVVAPTPPAPSSPASPPQEKPPVKSTVVERSIVPPSLPVPKTNKPVFSGKPKPTPPPKDSLSASPAPTSSTPAEKPIVKATVVERTIAPPTLPSPNTAKKSVFSGKHKAPTEPASSTPIPISTSVAPGKPLNGSSNGTKPTVEDEEEEEEEEEDEEDDGSDGYIEFSDVGEDGEDYEMDMDDRMMMREATVDYYRLKNLIQGRGGMEGLMDPGDGLIPGEEVCLLDPYSFLFSSA